MKKEMLQLETINDYQKVLSFYNPNLHPNSRV